MTPAEVGTRTTAAVFARRRPRDPFAFGRSSTITAAASRGRRAGSSSTSTLTRNPPTPTPARTVLPRTRRSGANAQGSCRGEGGAGAGTEPVVPLSCVATPESTVEQGAKDASRRRRFADAEPGGSAGGQG